MTFPIRVDLDSAVPIYVQIGKGIRNRLAAGHWKPGDRLPSVRETAVRLRVNPLTVVKAYRALQEEGLLETRPGAGVYAAPGSKMSRPRRREKARRAIESGLAEAAALGLDRDELETLVGRALRRVEAGKT